MTQPEQYESHHQLEMKRPFRTGLLFGLGVVTALALFSLVVGVFQLGLGVVLYDLLGSPGI